MATLSSHAVAYTIGPIFKYIIDCVLLCFNQWLHEYYLLKRELCLACRCHTYL